MFDITFTANRYYAQYYELEKDIRIRICAGMFCDTLLDVIVLRLIIPKHPAKAFKRWTLV